jgi:hypothetical protein
MGVGRDELAKGEDLMARRARRGRRIGHLLDHTAVIWRVGETIGEYRESEVAWGPEPVGPYDCTGKRKAAILAEAGPGTVDAGQRILYFEPGPTFNKRDLVELVTGPDAPAFLLVESDTRPRGNHIEVRVSEWHGAPPAVGS